LLSPTILAFALINPLSWILFSTGQLARSMKMALVLGPLVMLAYVFGLPFGAKGVAFGFSAMMGTLVVPLIAWATRGLVVTARDMFEAAKPPMLSAMAATIVCVAVMGGGQMLPVLPRLILEVGLLVAVYFVMLMYVMKQKRFYLELVRTVTGAPAAPPDIVETHAI
jgi:PST family polysaccharide transporter